MTKIALKTAKLKISQILCSYLAGIRVNQRVERKKEDFHLIRHLQNGGSWLQKHVSEESYFLYEIVVIFLKKNYKQ